VYTFKITYIFIIYNLNTFFFLYLYFCTQYIIIIIFFFLYWCYIASLLCYSYVCLYYHACLHYINKKWSDKDTDCICCVYGIKYGIKMVYIVEITRISAFRGYMTWKKVFFFFFFFDDFTLSPLGVPPGVRWILINNVTMFCHENIPKASILTCSWIQWDNKYLISCWFCTFAHWKRNDQSII